PVREMFPQHQELFRDFKGKSRAELEKMPKIAGSRLRVVKHAWTAPSRVWTNMEVCVSLSGAQSAPSHKGRNMNAGHFEDLNKALDVVFTRRLGAAYTRTTSRLDEATGRRHSRISARILFEMFPQHQELFRDFKGKSRAELEKMPKMRAHALGGVKHAGRRHPESGRHGGVRQLSGAHRRLAQEPPTFRAKHFEDLNAALAVVFERRLGKAFVDNKAVRPQVTFCEANRQCALLGAELVTDSGAISALASFTPRLWIGAADLADERDTDRTDWRLVNGAAIWRWRTASGAAGGPTIWATTKTACWSREATDWTMWTARMWLALRQSRPQPAAESEPGCQRLQAGWRPASFSRRSPYNTFNDYCSEQSTTGSDQPEGGVAACAFRASTKMRKTFVGAFLYNRRTSDCRLLLFTDSEVEEAVETSADWQKYVYATAP
uniref:GLOBIN domain-containing protein n=1 Tax=Macrostomum lignano TaxID=282301 RepID=A0A1I8F8L5_9PLAT